MTESVAQFGRFAVIGGGIAGLAAAHRITELSPHSEVVLFEAGDRLGGALTTLERDGFQVEQSADNFITTMPWGLDLCRRLGLEDRLERTHPRARRTYVVRRGHMHPLPEGFLMMAPAKMWPLATTPILSPWGKLRAAAEYFIPPRRDDGDESMAHFVRRRLGREVFQRLVEPLISAVYAADMERLSVMATLPRFREMERREGCLIRAMRKQMRQRRAAQKANTAAGTGGRNNASRESGARYSMFVALRGGFRELVDTLHEHLKNTDIRLQTPVTSLGRKDTGWTVHTAQGPESFDGVILAAPAADCAPLLRPLDTVLADELAGIEYSGTAIVSLGYRDEQVGHPLNGAGCVVPAIEKSRLLAISFSSRKYPHRAPEGATLLRVFVGGARDPEIITRDPREIRDIVVSELARLLHIRGEPVFEDVASWPGTMPQYHVGHRERVERIFQHAEALPGLALAGNAYYGVGVPHCIRSGEEAARRVLGMTEEADPLPRFGTV